MPQCAQLGDLSPTRIKHLATPPPLPPLPPRPPLGSRLYCRQKASKVKGRCRSTCLVKWLLVLSAVLRLRFQCYSASVDAAQTRDYQCGFEPSANINLALSHQQNIDIFHVQTYLSLRSIQYMGRAHHLLSFPIPPPIHIATQVTCRSSR